MDTVPQTVNCVDVLPRTSRHLHSHFLWTSLEPGHCHCAVCLMEPHMNISKPSVNRSNTGDWSENSHFSQQKGNTCDTKNIVFRCAGKCVRFPVCGVRAWDSSKMRESHARCVRLGRSVGLERFFRSSFSVGLLTYISNWRLYFMTSLI